MRDDILAEWMQRTYRAKPHHIRTLLQALPPDEKEKLLIRVYGELRGGGGSPLRHRGYTVDPYSAYLPQSAPALPPGAWPPAQAVQQQQQQQQQWASSNSVSKSAMANLNHAKSIREVQTLLSSDQAPITCMAQCTLGWRIGAGCGWTGGRCSAPAAVLVKDEQGMPLNANDPAMVPKITQMSGLTAPLVSDAATVAANDPHSQGLICVCDAHAQKITEWMQSTLPGLLKLGLGAAALGATAFGAQKLLTMSSAEQEKKDAKQKYELIKKDFITQLLDKKTAEISRIKDKILAGQEKLTPEEKQFLVDNGLTLEAGEADDKNSCPALAPHVQEEAQRKAEKDQQLQAALQAYEDQVLKNNNAGRAWTDVLPPAQVQTLRSSPDVVAGLGL